MICNFGRDVPYSACTERQDVAAHFQQFGTTTDVYLPFIPGRPGHKAEVLPGLKARVLRCLGKTFNSDLLEKL